MKKWNLIIDVEKCEDCNNCFLSCKDEHVDNNFLGYSLSQPRHGHRWVNIMRTERGQFPQIDVAYLPIFCMHCDNAPCIKAAQNGAVYKRNDGIVIIDPVKAQGQRHLVDACPYGAIWWNEEHTLPQKCTLCAHLLDQGWKEPRCVQACPTGALRIFKLEDGEMEEIVTSESLEPLHPEYNTKPRVYYKNLYRFTQCFIAGSVAIRLNGKEECVEGAKVTLLNSSDENIGEYVTDNYGDFKFDGLKENSGKYTLQITYTGYALKAIEVDLKQSFSAGTIVL
jgi:Fe-S-cluster-containing dehydrogenase component